MATNLLRRPVFLPAHGWPRAGTVRLVEIPARRCFSVEGEGAPEGQSFQEAVGALYTVAYTLRFALKRTGIDSRVGPLEGLWRGIPNERNDWQWRLLIEIPSQARDEAIELALKDARRRRPSAGLGRIQIATIDEGTVVEALHVGPYATEPATMARMLAVAEAAGLRSRGPHHEIYLGDPRRAAPERLRTVLRQGVE